MTRPGANRARDPYEYRRQLMVRQQIAARGVRDPRVLAAMREVPRHLFVREHLRTQAYSDHALPIEGGQTISQPYVVARMTEMLDLSPEHSVLEIGTGSGYQTLILARLARRVYSLERVPELTRRAIERLRQFALDVKIQTFDGTVGWSDVGPFDRILVTAAAPRAPQPLLDQLKTPGRLVVPEGTRDGQRLVVYEKDAAGAVIQQAGEAVSFVPLIGRHGWEDGN